MIRLLMVAAVLGCVGCTIPTEACPAAGDLKGTWRYAAVQDVPSGTTLSGTLAITNQSCGSFSGQLDVVQATSQGSGQRIGGPVNGRIIDAGSLRFDAVLEAAPRQHLASIAGDSLSGTWLLLDGLGRTVSGTFSLRRETR